jgi:hypothetical protein
MNQEEFHEEFVHCTECGDIEQCHDICAIYEAWKSDTSIAEQRGETPEQLWGDSK